MASNIDFSQFQPDPQAFDKGQDWVNRMYQYAAKRDAGALYGAGDYEGAAKRVAGVGDFDTAGKISDRGTLLSAGKQYAAGDIEGAGNTLAGGGQFTAAETLADKQIARVQKQQDILGKVGKFLEDAAKQDPNSAAQAWEWGSQNLQAAGIKPETIAKLQQQYTANPKQTIAQMKALAEHKYSYQAAGSSLFQFDESGNKVNEFKGDPAVPFGWVVTPTGAEPTKGGPHDPKYLAQEAAAKPKEPSGANVELLEDQNHPGTFYRYDKASNKITPVPMPGAAPAAPAQAPLSMDQMYEAVSKRDGIPIDTLKDWVKDDPETLLKRLYEQPVGAPETASPAASQGAPGQAPIKLTRPGASGVQSRFEQGQVLRNRQGAMSLRKEFDQLKDVKEFHDVANAADVIAHIGSSRTATDDVALIFTFMKALDPISVVREGEQATAQNTTGIPGQILNWYNRALSGNRLNDEQRAQFAATAKSIINARKTNYDRLVAQYQKYAKDAGYPDDTIAVRSVNLGAGPHIPEAAAANPAPARGVIQYDKQGNRIR